MPVQPGCDFTDVNYAVAAHRLGCVGISVEHPSEIRPAREKAFGTGRSALIDVVIDTSVIPPSAFVAEDIRSA